jgi:hypothetical protein
MAGAEEGRKDRPTIVLALSVSPTRAATRVLVVAVTHTQPNDPASAVPFPIDLKRAIGLDDLPAWIVTTEGKCLRLAGA